MDSPMYFVQRSDQYTSEEMTYRFKKIPVTISTSGFYQFECNIDNIPYFVSIGTMDLYTGSFNAKNLSDNRLKYEDGDEGIHRNSFGTSVSSGDYILVVSLTEAYEKTFSISVTGPADVKFAEWHMYY